MEKLSHIPLQNPAPRTPFMDNYKLRIVPLGGVLGVTKNMYVYELYKGDTLQDIIIVDCGIGFPREKELGVDFVIPDISYLKDKVKYIRAVLVTHGHEDHHSALPFHYRALGMPPVFTGRLTALFIANKSKEHDVRINVTVVQSAKEYSFGGFTVKFIHVTHSIPDTMHIFIKTPAGNFYHGADYKFDLTPAYGEAPEFYEIAKAGQEGVLCLLSDCLGAEREGFTLSEKVIGQTFEDEMRKTKGKFLMTTFSSNISRIRQCVEAAVKFNRKVVFMGRSMKENTESASKIGYLPIPYEMMAKENDIMRLPPNKLCLIVAGSQGQYNSALSKIAMRQNKAVRIKPGDKVVFSSDPIPGNEIEIYALIEELSKAGAHVVYSDIQEQLHTSGHGNQEDMKLLMRLTKPQYFIPIGGEGRHQRQYQELIGEMGYKKENAFLLEEGQTVWFEKKTARAGDHVETRNIYVDAYGIGDVGSIVLRDRQTLSSEGIVVALLIIDSKSQLVEAPRLLSRGFVFEPKEKDLFQIAQKEIQSILKPRSGGGIDISVLRREVVGRLENLFFEARGRKPLIIVDIVQI